MLGFFRAEPARERDLVSTLVFKEEIVVFCCRIADNGDAVEVGMAVVAHILSAEFLVELKVV